MEHFCLSELWSIFCVMTEDTCLESVIHKFTAVKGITTALSVGTDEVFSSEGRH